jgi:hypothetical protein
VEFATLSDLSFVENWRDTLGTNPEPKQREAVDLAQLAQERFLADSRVGQQYLTTLDDLRDHIARDPHVKLAASSSSDVTGLPTLKSSGSATSGLYSS